MKSIRKYTNLGFMALFLLLILSACSINQKSFDASDNYLPTNEILGNEQSGEQLIGGDKDEYGCLIAAGYSWCEVKQKCLRSWEEECVKTISQDNSVDKKFESIADSVTFKVYENKELNYTVTYPDIANIVGDDLASRVEFFGALQGDDWWPKFSISHYNSAFYHPPKGTVVKDWVKMFPDYKLGEERNIGGEKALHFIQEKSKEFNGYDYYYFIKGTQLYQITIVHTSGHEDWPLYNKFLDSFKFTEVQVSRCQTDADCVPMPACHPRECINSQYVSNYPQPEVCTELFDCQAAYKAEDCLCQEGFCQNINLGGSCQ